MQIFLYKESETDMKTAFDLSPKLENYFRQLEQDYDATQRAYRHILTTLNTALPRQDYAALYDMIPYIESGEGHLAFQYIGKTHRFLRMLNIIALEGKYHKLMFCDDCDSAEALWEKYMLTLFSFRRLLFRLSDESVEEASIYLRNHPISHFAAYMIATDELLIPNQPFYQSLALIYAQSWEPEDTQQFLSLMNQPQTAC